MTYSDVLVSWARLCGFPILDDGKPETSIASVFLDFFKIRWREAMLAAQWSFATEVFRLPVCNDGYCPLGEKKNRYVLKCYDRDWRIDDRADSVRFKRVGDALLVPDLPCAEPVAVSGTPTVGDVERINGGFYCLYANGSQCRWSGDVYDSAFAKGEGGFIPMPVCAGDIVLDGGNAYFCFEDVSTLGSFSASDTAHFIKLNKGVSANLFVLSRAEIWTERESYDALEVPEQFEIFIIRGAQADWLRSQNRNDEAEIAESKARAALDAEVFEAENFQGVRVGTAFAQN